MRTITFYTHYNYYSIRSYKHTKDCINEKSEHIYTNQLIFISFDLLDKFDKIYLNVNDVIYELKLGQNTWIDKDLRVAHNLLKLVTANILNKI